MSEAYDIYKSSKEYDLWPTSESKFLDVLYGKSDTGNKTKVFTELANNEVVGFMSIKTKFSGVEKRASIVSIFVKENLRNKGIGHKLLQEGISWLKSEKVTSVKFGTSAGSYFWPGIPENLISLHSFLESEGFLITDGPVDMCSEITNFTVPANTYKGLEENGVTIEFSTREYKDQILEFTKKNFPDWYEYYLEDLTKEKFNNIFFARKGDEIIAISKLWIGGNWDLLFGNSVGGGGALGVSKEWRGKGMGLAMKSWGTEILKDKGIKYVWVGWTYSTGFYEKLGFTVWRKYFNAELSF